MFQGSERDVIFLSCVRAGAGGIGFVKESQRLNVALTRARKCLVVVGNMKTLSSCNPMWRELLENAKERDLFRNYEKSVNLKTLLRSS